MDGQLDSGETGSPEFCLVHCAPWAAPDPTTETMTAIIAISFLVTCSSHELLFPLMTLTMQVEVFDSVLGNLNALLPSEVDTVAIVNATPDAGHAEEHLEII